EQEHRQIFEKWIGQYKALLFRVVRSYAFTHVDRDDLFQEIAVQIWHSVRAFKGDAAVTTWLYRIALNTALKWIRKESKHYEARQPLESLEHILEEGTLMDERLAWLYDEIARLDEIDRSIAILLLDGFSYKEMAGVMGITESHIGVKINRIKKQLIL